jgi:D-alanyl-D-alanine carboxypeptidase
VVRAPTITAAARTPWVLALVLVAWLSPGAAVLAQPVRAQSVRDQPLHTALDTALAGVEWQGVASVRSVGGAAAARVSGAADARDDRPLEAETPFWIGSISKHFAAAAVLRLVADGRLALDAPLHEVVPGLAPLSRDGVVCTIDHVLDHTCGLPAEVSAQTAGHLTDPARARALVEAVSRAGLAFAPGSDAAYSNVGYDLLGLAVQRASGAPYADSLRRAFFEPLGMASTGAGAPPSSIEARMARGTLWTPLGPLDSARWLGTPALAGARLGAAGNVWSTAADLARFTEALHSGRVLPPAQYDRMVTPARAAAQVGSRDRYGAGLAVRGAGPSRVIWHNGALDPHGFNSFLAWIPARGTSVVLLSNASRGVVDATALGHALSARLAGAPRDAVRHEMALATIPRFRGLFLLGVAFACALGLVSALARGPRAGAIEHLCTVATLMCVLLALRGLFVEPSELALGLAAPLSAGVTAAMVLRRRVWRAAERIASRRGLWAALASLGFVVVVLGLTLPGHLVAIGLCACAPPALALSAIRRWPA